LTRLTRLISERVGLRLRASVTPMHIARAQRTLVNQRSPSSRVRAARDGARASPVEPALRASHPAPDAVAGVPLNAKIHRLVVDRRHVPPNSGLANSSDLLRKCH
jgi:hypothetical protein